MKRLILAAVFAMVCTHGHAAAQLDQAYEPSPAPNVVPVRQDTREAAQTFTVGLSGTLAQVDILVNNSPGSPASSTIAIQIYSVAGGEPNTALTGLFSFGPAGIPFSPGFISYDVSAAGLSVTSGEELAVVVTSPASSGFYNFRADTVAGYSGGTALLRNLPGGSWEGAGIPPPVDFGFRTFVDAVAVSDYFEVLPTLTAGKNINGTDIDAFWDVSDPQCQAFDYNLFYGDLADVSSYVYSGDACALGVLGQATLTPPAGDLFFVIASEGADGTEGHHGRDGDGAVRPASAAAACGAAVQDVAASCP